MCLWPASFNKDYLSEILRGKLIPCELSSPSSSDEFPSGLNSSTWGLGSAYLLPEINNTRERSGESLASRRAMTVVMWSRFTCFFGFCMQRKALCFYSAHECSESTLQATRSTCTATLHPLLAVIGSVVEKTFTRHLKDLSWSEGRV